jgi:NAD(P)-dependent dehydrogenase (short-subunit alcohol dehydrogenase family)
MAQVWLVTGSSRGLGRAIVEAGLTAGNKVLATARDIKSLAISRNDMEIRSSSSQWM